MIVSIRCRVDVVSILPSSSSSKGRSLSKTCADGVSPEISPLSLERGDTLAGEAGALHVGVSSPVSREQVSGDSIPVDVSDVIKDGGKL